MATHVLSLQIGSTNIPLTSSNSILLDVDLPSPALQLTVRGGEIHGSERTLVTATIRCHFFGSTGADVQSKLQSIERLLELCAQRQATRTGDRGYLYLRLGPDTETWRSEIVSGIVQADNPLRTLNVPAVDVFIVCTLRPFWETVVERELPLDNSSAGAKATGGVTIYNHDDATSGHDNWTDIAAADVAGNVPAPLRIQIKNTSGVDLATRNFYQSNNAFHVPTTFPHILEGEAATYATPTADANSSGGYYERRSWVTSIDHTVSLFNWDLSAALLAGGAGGFFRVLCRFASTPPSGMEFQLRLMFPAGGTPLTAFWSGPKFTSTDKPLQDLGVIQLPPGIASPSHYEMALVLSAAYTGTSQLDIDFLQITPANATKHFLQVGYLIPPNDFIVNDGPENRVYNIDAATGLQVNIFSGYSSVLNVWPNRDQRLIFLHDDSSMTISRTWLVQAFYRPRRLTI